MQKMAEPMEMPFGGKGRQTGVCSRNYRVVQKMRPLRLKAQIFACPHLQNARTCMINFMNMESTDVGPIQNITALK